MRLSFLKQFMLSILAVSVFIACSRNENSVSSNKARLQVALTDDPADYEAVFIDVRDVMINYSSDPNNGWESLPNVRVGEYDVLRLINDDDTILADAEIEAGTISQIRLVLGPNNFIQINGQRLPLETPSAQQSGLKLNIHHDVEAGLLYKLTLDFDVARSIRETGNGRYILKPVIRTVLEAAGGSIKGFVSPFSFQSAVLAFRAANDTVASTYSATTNGGYLIKGLAPGTYHLHIMPSDPAYGDTVINNINVTNGVVTLVDTTFLQ